MTNQEDSMLKAASDADGQPISPVLPPGIRNFLIDIDGTICEDVPNEEPERMRHCQPFPEAMLILTLIY